MKISPGVPFFDSMILKDFFFGSHMGGEVVDFRMPRVKGQLGVTVYPWYLLCSPGILGDYNP